MRNNMMRCLVLFYVILPWFSVADTIKPPSSATIYDTLEQLWGGREFAEVDAYVKQLAISWSNYLPVQLTLATYSYQYGGQVEDAVDRLKTLREKLSADVRAASPMFMELLDSRIIRYEDLSQFYSMKGISREQRLTERNPLKKTKFKHAKHWAGVDDMLYFNAPEVFLTEGSSIPAYPDGDEPPDFDVTQKDASELLELIGGEIITMRTRKAAVKELIRIRETNGNPNELIQGFDEGVMGYTYHDTVEALVEIGVDAIPSIFNVLTDPGKGLSAAKYSIWALLRIGVYDEQVADALKSVINNPLALPDLVNYAKNAKTILNPNNESQIR